MGSKTAIFAPLLRTRGGGGRVVDVSIQGQDSAAAAEAVTATLTYLWLYKPASDQLFRLLSARGNLD